MVRMSDFSPQKIWCRVDPVDQNSVDQTVDGPDGDRGAYHERLRITTRRSALAAGVVLLVAWPVWGVFDWLVLPARAGEFITVRAVFEVPIALALVSLWRPRIGGRWPEEAAFVLLALPQVAIAWMIPRSQPRLDDYLLGFSLVIFGSAVVVVWRWQLTLWLTAVTLSATALTTLLYRPGLSRESAGTIAFFLGTAGVVAVVGQLHRYRAGWDQFRTESALQAERQRNDVLVDELRKLSDEDPLTGVGNRRAWEHWVRQEWALVMRGGRSFSVVVCDFDRFKEVNDTYGHAFGDEVLRVGAAALRSGARTTDLVARLGGDEFVIGCPDTDAHAAEALAHRIADATRSLAWPDGVLMTLSFGVAQVSPDDENIAALMDRADMALYQAKISRDTVTLA